MTRLVVDASAIVDLLSGAPAAGTIRSVLEDAPEVHVPEHFHVEGISALRGLASRGEITLDHTERALDLLGELRAVRHATWPLKDRIWALRENLSAYDAAYLAVAEAIDGQLLTADRALAAAAAEHGRLAAR